MIGKASYAVKKKAPDNCQILLSLKFEAHLA